MSKIVSDPRLPVVKDEKIRPLTQRLYELFRQYAIAHNKSYMWDTEGTAAPTTGTWSISQMCKNTAPAAAGIIGWVCTTSGTPGTWYEIVSGGKREILTSNRTYYVRTDGSDSNNGLTNTSGGAFLTIQKAIDVISSTLDIAAGVTATVQVGDGTYTSPVVMKTYIGGGSVVIQGNSGTPANVLISTTSNHCFYNTLCGVSVMVKDMKLQTTTSGSCLLAGFAGVIYFTNIDFGACAAQHIYGLGGGYVYATGNYSISGSAQSHLNGNRSGNVEVASKTITITGTPAFSIGFAVASLSGGVTSYGCTFSGSATGLYYTAYLNGTINTLGGGATYFPGDTSGTTPTGGQYA